MRLAEKSVLLQLLDQAWKEHLLALDHLRQGIGLRSFAQRDPLNEYKREAFGLFEGMLLQIREKTTETLMKIELRINAPEALVPQRRPQQMQELRPEPEMAEGGYGEGSPQRQPMQPQRNPRFNAADPSTWGETQRNAACPCGSGKKYKHCHGKV